MIAKEGDRFVVRSEDGKSLGAYPSRQAAEERLKQVEMHKHMKRNADMNQRLRGK